MSFRTPVLTAIVAISALTPVQSASAQTYPTKPIHMIVPYPAGGGTDFFARLIGQKMSELVGQPIVVENKPGAATNLGADFVAKAPPDGYTVLLGDVATYAANPSLYKKLPFDPARRQGIGGIGSRPARLDHWSRSGRPRFNGKTLNDAASQCHGLWRTIP